MRGVVFAGERQLELMEFPDPTPGEGEVVVEIKASGMCGSDLHQYRRPKGGQAIGGLPAATEPVIAGHEPCGIIAAIGPGVPAARARIDERVMVHHYKGCTYATTAARAGRSCARSSRCWSTATTRMAATPST